MKKKRLSHRAGLFQKIPTQKIRCRILHGYEPVGPTTVEQSGHH